MINYDLYKEFSFIYINMHLLHSVTNLKLKSRLFPQKLEKEKLEAIARQVQVNAFLGFIFKRTDIL